ncbi:protein-L-isoaspartate(D-aspartate) O-methyltransferase [Undibacterium sp. SXout7W]|uniref:protein-L-isoaspartate(D-aspartate) O-methyltransferase n=1 Tax=Undibacterium sp. SXout7W TaxID=3413049 RepID=UPI003BF1019C
MNSKEKRFPLNLSSVVDQKDGVNRQHIQRTVTPQTAMKNVTFDTVNKSASPVRDSGSSKPKTALMFNVPVQTQSPFQSPSSTYTQPLVPDAVRKAMVARVRQQGVADELVLAAMEAVQRHLFLDSGLSGQAYVDASLPIGHHQTISQPYIVARMVEIMRNGSSMSRVLEIGTGCGYQAAVLSLVAKEVYSIERIKALHELAKNNLRPMRIANIRLHYGDGMLGLPQVAPFDGIILAAAGMEVPQALLQQLRIGGRLVAPVGGRHQVLQLVERMSNHEWSSVVIEDCHFVPLHSGVI